MLSCNHCLAVVLACYPAIIGLLLCWHVILQSLPCCSAAMLSCNHCLAVLLPCYPAIIALLFCCHVILQSLPCCSASMLSCNHCLAVLLPCYPAIIALLLSPAWPWVQPNSSFLALAACGGQLSTMVGDYQWLSCPRHLWTMTVMASPSRGNGSPALSISRQ